MQRLAGRSDHGTPQLVQQHPGGFVLAEPQVSLQQERRDPSLVGRHEIRRPEPRGMTEPVMVVDPEQFTVLAAPKQFSLELDRANKLPGTMYE